MAGRSKKRAGKRSSNASTGEVDEQTAVKRGGTVQAIRTWNDVEHDSDEDFDDSRDKVLLDYDRRTARRSGGNDDSGSESDGEVFGVTAADSDDQSDGESDGSGGNFFADSDDGDNDRDARLDDGAWGKQRENYYFADDMGEDSADDDAAFAEEAEEALRLQKRQLEALDEDDFID
ncbi:something about silencing protein 10, partial [Coemansia sp. RSA 2607]